MKIFVYSQEKELVVLDDPAAKTLMQAIRDAGMNIAAQCGGSAACATCHVYVDEAWFAKLKPAAEIEDAMLDLAEERQENSRLSCQIELSEDLDGVTVTLAPGAEI
ncbi:2Fe-2S iron-sulfur cluster-binding protein [Nocardia sp. NPDC059246]|uniref:2Fe-2S iron-sulfur cluster-binding protein n=1 Tax=unclassified Nocardia TaxID=2637762 RepID=UPI0036BD8E26